MPEIEGFTLQKMLQEKYGQNIPFMFMTGLLNKSQAPQCLTFLFVTSVFI